MIARTLNFADYSDSSEFGWIESVVAHPSTMIDESLLAKVTTLSPADRLELIGVVWDTLSPEDLPVTDAERKLLDARLADMEAHPEGQSP